MVRINIAWNMCLLLMFDQVSSDDGIDWVKTSGRVNPDTGPAADHTLRTDEGISLLVNFYDAQPGMRAATWTQSYEPTTVNNCLTFWWVTVSNFCTNFNGFMRIMLISQSSKIDKCHLEPKFCFRRSNIYCEIGS